MKNQNFYHTPYKCKGFIYDNNNYYLDNFIIY